MGVFVGGRAIDAVDNAFPAVDPTLPVVVAAAVGWLIASWIASRIRSELKPRQAEDPELLRHQLRRVVVEFRDGARGGCSTCRALGPITSITIDQIGQGSSW